MHRISSYRERINHLWQVAVGPPESITDPQQRHRIRLLNGLLVIFVPLALGVLALHMLIDPISNLAESTSVKAITMGIGIVLLLYVVNHTKHYRIASYLAIFCGFIAIFTNAIASASPHIEIIYLVLLPLVGVLLLSRAETLVVCAISAVSLVLFAAAMANIPQDIFKDLLTFTLLSQAFILFVYDQRDRLELDRQQLAVTQANNDMLNQLITNLGHDFRTPLSVINSNLYLLRHVQDPAKQQERIEQIEQQSRRIHRLIEDILTMSRLDQPTAHQLKPVELRAMLETLLWQYQTPAEKKNIHLHLVSSDTQPSVLANSETLRQAFAHIIENAVHYTDPDGEITIRLFEQANEAIVEVTDTGIGLPTDDLTAIFDPFHRVDKARSTQTGGTGLGLSITKRIVEMHNGEIEVESMLAQGSTFRIRLPVVQH